MGEFLYQYILYGCDAEGNYFAVVFSFENESTSVSVQPYMVKIGEVCTAHRLDIDGEVLMMNNIMSKGLAREHWNSLLEKGFNHVAINSNWKFDYPPKPPIRTHSNTYYDEYTEFDKMNLDRVHHIISEYLSGQIDKYESTTNYALEA